MAMQNTINIWKKCNKVSIEHRTEGVLNVMVIERARAVRPPNQQVAQVKTKTEEEKKRRHTTQENDFIDVNKNMSQRPTQTRGKNFIGKIIFSNRCSILPFTQSTSICGPSSG